MTKEHETAKSSQRGRKADSALVEGFRPLALPAVAAAAKAMARRPDATQAATGNRERGERDRV